MEAALALEERVSTRTETDDNFLSEMVAKELERTEVDGSILATFEKLYKDRKVSEFLHDTDNYITPAQAKRNRPMKDMVPADAHYRELILGYLDVLKETAQVIETNSGASYTKVRDASLSVMERSSYSEQAKQGIFDPSTAYRKLITALGTKHSETFGKKNDNNKNESGIDWEAFHKKNDNIFKKAFRAFDGFMDRYVGGPGNYVLDRILPMKDKKPYNRRNLH